MTTLGGDCTRVTNQELSHCATSDATARRDGGVGVASFSLPPEVRQVCRCQRGHRSTDGRLDLVEVRERSTDDWEHRVVTRHAEQISDLPMRRSASRQSTHLQNIGVRQRCRGVLTTALVSVSVPSSLLAIAHVVGVRPVNQMVGANTWRVIARVSRHLREHSVRQQVRHSMRSDSLVTEPEKSVLLSSDGFTPASELPAGHLIVDDVRSGPEPVGDVVQRDGAPVCSPLLSFRQTSRCLLGYRSCLAHLSLCLKHGISISAPRRKLSQFSVFHGGDFNMLCNQMEAC